jgi:hypothetical protein
MFKEIEDMDETERIIFDMYCDLEYALVQEYDLMDADNVSDHLKDAVKRWSKVVWVMDLIDTYLYEQAQKMADSDDSWVTT